MSDRRRIPARPSAESDQKVWGYPAAPPGPGYPMSPPEQHYPASPPEQSYAMSPPGQNAYAGDRARSGAPAGNPGYPENTAYPENTPYPENAGYADERAYRDTSRGRRHSRHAPEEPARPDEYGRPEPGPWGEREPDDAYYDDPPKRRWGRRSQDPFDEESFHDPGAADDEEPRGRRRGRRGADGGGDYDTHRDTHQAAAGYAAERGAYDAQRPASYAAGAGADFGPPGDDPPRRRRGGGDGKRALGVAGWVGIVMTSVLVIGTLTAYKIYRDTFGLIKRGSSTDELDKNRPVNQTGAINVLLVGSDTRAGDNKKYGQHMQNEGERTDTIMMLHVSPNRDTVTLLSFPRDSVVLIPNCKNVRTGGLIPQHLGMINSAFNDGGMICTRRTVETLTGIPVDHWVKVDFTGFKNIVNALGGIEICLPQAVNDKLSKLNLSEGRHTVKGEEALAYVRLRHGIGDGSDIGRIKRQQVFISQVVKKATSGALLTDFPKLQGFIRAAAQSVTMDDNLDTEALIQIAQSASKLTAKGFKATTVPWIPDPSNPQARVVWKQPDANNLFAGIRGDVDVTPTAASPSASPGATSAAPTVTQPSQVKVQVFNGTNTTGKAKEVAEALAGQGFKVTSIGDARKSDGGDQPKTLIRYTGQGWDYAKILQSKLLTTVAPETGKVVTGPVTPFVPVSATPTTSRRVAGPVIQLVVGTDWKGVKVPLSVGDNAITSKTNICAS